MTQAMSENLRAQPMCRHGSKMARRVCGTCECYLSQYTCFLNL